MDADCRLLCPNWGFANTPLLCPNWGCRYDHLVPAHFTLDAVTAIPLICFSFQCHVTFPLVYASMKGRVVVAVPD